MKMFKKAFFLVLTLCMVLSLMPISVFAENNNAYKYSITPNSIDWKNHKSYELFQRTNIPENIVKEMNTATLVSVVMDYPFLGDIYAFDNPEIGIQVVSERFSGLKELLGRRDAGVGIYNKYMSMKKEVAALKNPTNVNFQTAMNYKIMGTLLSHPVIFNKLNKAQVDSIVESSNAISKKVDVAPIYADKNSPFAKTALAAAYRTTYVFTPKFSPVQVLIRGEELTYSDKYYMDQYMASRYPNAQKLRTATTNYNCHSYAWYSTSSTNIYWMNDPSKYMSDGSYTKVGVTPTASGQKMYYPGSNAHSAIVYTPSSDIWNIVLTSKWGAYGLYRHKYGEDPYGNGVISISCWKLS